MLFKTSLAIALVLSVVSAATAQDAALRPIGQPDNTANLPVQKIGKADLLNIQVYDSPELTRSVRVLDDGRIRLPMMKELVRVEGLFPADVEILIADELKREQLLVDPFVTVTVGEYHSRPISVSGAVKNPTIFQAIGPVNLLDALAKAGGLADQAGGDIVITRDNGNASTQSVQRIPVKPLIEGTDAELNVKLVGGEQIRVPIVGTVVVTGNVKESGVFPVQDGGTTTVLTAIAQAKGLGDFQPKMVYIYRTDAQGVKHEIPVDLKAIKDRKAKDEILQAKDVLYVPDNHRAKLTDQMLTLLTGVGASSATALIYTRGR